LSEPNTRPTNASDQHLPSLVDVTEKVEKQRAAERKAFLTKRLKIKGYSLRAWADQAGVAVYTVRCYWNGKTNPHPSTLWKLARALGISIEKMPR